MAASEGTYPIKVLKPHWYGPYAGPDDPQARFVADYNLFHGVAPPVGYHPPFPDDHERIRNDWWGAHNVEPDPLFTDPEQGDYRLRDDIPARVAD